MVAQFSASQCFFFFQGGPEFGLIATYAIDPYIMLLEDGFHRKDFIEITAMVGVVDKKEFALFIALTGFGYRRNDVDDIQFKSICDFMPEGHGLRKMETGIEKIDRDPGLKPADQMKEWEAMGLKGRTDEAGFPGSRKVCKFLSNAFNELFHIEAKVRGMGTPYPVNHHPSSVTLES